MNAMLIDTLCILSFAISPGLLVLHFWLPRWFPRWALVVSATCLGGAAFYLSEFLQTAEMTRRFGGFEMPPPAEMSGMVVLKGPSRADFMLGALFQLAYLILWLVPYGVMRILLDRRRNSGQAAA